MRLVLEFDSNQVARLRRLKERDGHGKDSWEEWLKAKTQGIPMEEDVLQSLGRKTREELSKLWMENLRNNLEGGHVTYSIDELGKRRGPAIVVGASPHVKRLGQLEAIRESGYGGAVVSTDRMIADTLQAAIKPGYVVSVDGNRELIPAFYAKDIVRDAGLGLTGLFATTVAEETTKIFEGIGGSIYWFNPMVDDVQDPNSVSRHLQYLTGVPTLTCGGNTGAAAITLAWYLGHDPIVLIGMAYGYPADTPLEETGYWPTFLEASEGDAEKAKGYFKKVLNPDTGEECLTDTVFQYYKSGILDIAKQMRPTRLINSTGGGLIYGKNVETMPLDKFLEGCNG